mgnify:CR=1 FL=1
MSDDLSAKERAVLLTLLVHGPTLSNPEMERVAGLTLDGKEREHLNKLGLVESKKPGRSYTHTLTPDGRKWCANELTTASPRAGAKPLERALYAVIGAIGHSDEIRSMLGLSQGEPKTDTALDDKAVESAIRAAYRKLRRERGGWVSLADLRDELNHIPADVLDAGLKRLNRQPGVVLAPEYDQTVLTKRQRDAALKLGGQLKHLISIEGA